MRFPKGLTLAMVVTLLLAGCTATSPSNPEPNDSTELNETATIEPTPTPEPTFEAQVIGSGGADITHQGGYTARFDFEWTGLQRIELADLQATVPECYDDAKLALTGNADGVVYISRISGTISYPTVDGFTWPENQPLGLAVKTLYSRGFNSPDGQNVCGRASDGVGGGALPGVPSVPGGPFDLYVYRVSGKTPNNPNGDLPTGEITTGSNSSTTIDQLLGSRLELSGVINTCDSNCRFELPVPPI